jgi:hypothetical protein
MAAALDLPKDMFVDDEDDLDLRIANANAPSKKRKEPSQHHDEDDEEVIAEQLPPASKKPALGPAEEYLTKWDPLASKHDRSKLFQDSTYPPISS